MCALEGRHVGLPLPRIIERIRRRSVRATLRHSGKMVYHGGIGTSLEQPRTLDYVVGVPGGRRK